MNEHMIGIRGVARIRLEQIVEEGRGKTVLGRRRPLRNNTYGGLRKSF